jgi:hypothetical protein
MPHDLVEMGMGGRSVSMNKYERERARQRPWYRRLGGLPSQAEIDSWNLKRPDRASTIRGETDKETDA